MGNTLTCCVSLNTETFHPKQTICFWGTMLTGESSL